MEFYKRISNIAGWLVFFVAATVYYFSAERTGSLWDCGEFISGAYKLEVVHPPGAPLFLIVGRMFAWLASVFSDNPETIAFSVNLLSGICTAFAATFVCWVTIMLGKMALKGREEEPDGSEAIALAGAGLVAGLTTAFCTSIWFSAVEGEVYAMSTFFTAMTLWAVIKWYVLPDTPSADRWLVFAIYSAGLSMGVHLLSLLTFPALALFFYFKKYQNHNLTGMLISAVAGVGIIGAVQLLVIVGLPKLWSTFELMMVNGLGMPFHSGLIPVVLLVAGAVWFGLRYARQHKIAWLELTTVSALMVVISFATIGVIVIRANANTPINMNNPSDAMRLIPYLNREQYGERPLFRGPDFDARPVRTEVTDRYGRVGDRYEKVDQKITPIYNPGDMKFFPRLGDYSQGRPSLYRAWLDKPSGSLTFGDNLSFMFNYQVGWMYWRYFMWNFAGRQNGDQGFYSWDPRTGNWYSGISFLDSARLYNQSELPQTMLDDKGRNRYFMLPFLFGLIGLFFHFSRRSEDALGLLAMFIITGLGIIIYSNQPPNEPRERDYVLVGSFFTYAIWVGMAVLAVFELLRKRVQLNGSVAAAVAAALILVAPALMGFQNFDDHSRQWIKASRDYASNFLQSVEENAIIFTYGDNDTYPLWYCQEVEGIRRDVRVVNLSLIAVDWYIDQLRRKVNDSPAIKMTIPQDAYRGKKRNQIFYYNNRQTSQAYDPNQDRELPLTDLLRFVGDDKNKLRASDGSEIEGFFPTKRAYLNIDLNKMRSNGLLSASDTSAVSRIDIQLMGPNDQYLIKDDLAVLDVISSNIEDRPIYFAVTCRADKMFNLAEFMQLEGLAVRLIPVRSTPDRQFGVIGNGRVATDKLYNNIMEKFRWGNFDKYDLYVDRSYAPSVQSLQLIMLRGAGTLLDSGDKTRAIELMDKYFEAFPHMNFPYDSRTMMMINVYLQAGAYDKAKPHLEILAREMADYLNFYSSLDPAQQQGAFQQDIQQTELTRNQIIQTAKTNGDTAFEEELKNLFGSLDFSNSLVPTQPGELQR